jgi:5'-3' exonuclease
MAFNFSDKLEESKGNTLILDSLNLAFRYKHAGRTDYRYDYLKTLKSLAQSYNCGNIIITSDQGASSYRRGIDPNYKVRDYPEQTEEEKAFFEEFFHEYEETLDVFREEGYPVLRYKGVEADDIAAHLVNNRELYNLGNIWLISSDRDWDLLVSEKVSRFSFVTRKEITVDTWDEHYKVSREDYISYKCLMGDKGDNVPGVDGVGPVKAASLIKTYGSAMDIYDALPLPSKYVYMRNVNEFGEKLLTNYELMDLVTYCDDAIGEENLKDIKEKLNEV